MNQSSGCESDISPCFSNQSILGLPFLKVFAKYLGITTPSFLYVLPPLVTSYSKYV
eukprot:CAMPEP_0172491644 /NCGR_PEP_ID=MMETSP1066-20121228/22530_1 /TAXON_ID=671091 /ORGANISM="Coscinodiscus wailesii, Strain CCMP2513" /LENGTH=55 /DNA_ID=CAMNT_0013260805 /DNA_START=378 /DNA_END=545 /DNA_ORIENTATION=+